MDRGHPGQGWAVPLCPPWSFPQRTSSSSAVQVVASDRGRPPRKRDHILQVTVLDVNDNPPVIESPFGYNVSVNEVRAARASSWTSSMGSSCELTTGYLFQCLPALLTPPTSAHS